MNLTFTASEANSVYINNDYVSIADSATLVSIILPAGATFTSFPSLAGTGLSYDTVSSPKRITGNPTGAHIGVTIPVTLADLTTGSFTLEVIKPTYTAVTAPCGLSTLFTDTMVANNPALSGRGTITYSIQVDNVWTVLGSINRGGSFTANGSPLDIGTYPIKAVYTAGTATIINAEYDNTITFIEYRPELNLSYASDSTCAGDCCGSIAGQSVVVTADFNTNQTSGSSTLTWTIQDKDGNFIGDPVITTIDNTNPGAADPTLTFTPTGKMDYIVTAVLDNGCTVCTKVLIVKACDYITLNEVLNGCNQYTLKNCSLTNAHTFTVIDILTMTPVSSLTNIPLGINSTVNITLPGDGVYQIAIYNGDTSVKTNFPVIADCGIKACLSTKFTKIYCADCKCKQKCECNTDTDIYKILPLAYMFYSYVNQIYTLNSNFSMLDTATITALQSISSTMEKLKIFCKDCGPVKKGKNCGCK